MLISAHCYAETVRPSAVILMDIAKNGNTFIAVGERGTVLRSVDDGVKWDVATTDVTASLTATTFLTQDLGIAVGHGGALIRTEDSGKTWKSVPVPGLQRETILGVQALSAQQVVAFGAFGLFLYSDDGGLHWIRKEIVGPDFDRHLYGFAIMPSGHWLLVGESGTMVESSDKGASWHLLPSPYAGSFFGVLVTKAGSTMVYGMRGNLYRSLSGSSTWTKVETGTVAGFNGSNQLADGRIVLTGNNGQMSISDDDGATVHTTTVNRSTSLARATETSNASLLLVGDNGVMHATLPHVNSQEISR